MSKRAKRKLLNGCMAAAVALSTTLTPVVANAATPLKMWSLLPSWEGILRN